MKRCCASCSLYSVPDFLSAIGIAKTVMGKRHNIIHDNWALSEDGSSIMRMSMPLKDGTKNSTPVALNTLTTLIEDGRKISAEALALAMTIPPAKLAPYPGIHVGPKPPGQS